MIEFAHEGQLVWGLLAPVFVLLAWWGYRRRSHRLAVMAGGPARGGIALLAGRALAKGILVALASVALTFALAQPRWGFTWTKVERSGADIVIAVDVSQSMLASDVDPSRLTRAKRKLTDLLAMLEGDQVALVAFAGEAFVQCPLTVDYGAVRMFLDYLDPALIPVQGTDIGRAIDTALTALKDGGRAQGDGGDEDDPQAADSGEAQARGRQAILLLTDGEDLEGAAQVAAAKAKAAGVRIYTMGIGSEIGAPVPEPEGGFKKDAQGNLVISKPDEAALAKLALDTGGIYVRAVGDDMDLAKIYREGMRSDLADKPLGESRRKLWTERFQWFVGMGFALLTFEALLRDSRVLLWLIMVGAASGILGTTPSAKANAARDAHRAYEHKEYDKAAQDFLNAEIDDPEDPEQTYNRGVAEYRAKRYDRAAEAFAGAAQKALGKAPELAKRSYFNQGNAQVQQKKLDEAIESYKKALEIAPSDTKVQENLAYAEQMKAMPPPPPQKDEQQSSDKDEKKSDSEQNQSAQQDSQKSNANESESGDKSQQKAADPSKTDASKDGQSTAARDQDKAGDPSQAGAAGEDQKKSADDLAKAGAENEKAAESQAGGPDPQKPRDDAAMGSQSADHQKPEGAKEANASQSDADQKGIAQEPAPGAEKREGKTGQANAAPVGTLSPEEAERILRQAEDRPDKFLYSRQRNKNRSDRKLGKDW